MSVIVRPVIVLGAPRSGTTIVRNCLALHPDLWHLAGESHGILEGPFDPRPRGYVSNRVEAGDVDDGLARHLRQAFAAAGDQPQRRHPAGRRATTAATRWPVVSVDKVRTRVAGAASMRRRPDEIRFLEKTPKNMLRVPMLERLFPDALYVHLTRDAPSNIDSLIEGWRAVDRIGPVTRPRFARSGYPIARQLALRDYTGKWWKFALVPGWRDLPRHVARRCRGVAVPPMQPGGARRPHRRSTRPGCDASSTRSSWRSRSPRFAVCSSGPSCPRARRRSATPPRRRGVNTTRPAGAATDCAAESRGSARSHRFDAGNRSAARRAGVFLTANGETDASARSGRVRPVTNRIPVAEEQGCRQRRHCASSCRRHAGLPGAVERERRRRIGEPGGVAGDGVRCVPA